MRWQPKRGERFWKATSGRSRLLFAFAVFFIFGSLGVLIDVPRPTHTPLWGLAVYVVLFGATGVAYVFTTLWDLRLVPIAFGLNIAVSMFGDWATSSGRATALGPADQHARLVLDAIASFSFVVAGYAFFIRFMHGIVHGHVRLQTEITLAKGIHDSLVPTVTGHSQRVDYYGRSQPSGAMGGDLVDVFEGPEGTTYYLVDVSGHGVGAGVLMAMLKSAARAALAAGATLPTLLQALDRAVHDLGRAGTFATCACIQVSRAGPVRYALAGHLPILHRRAASGEVMELAIGGPLLGVEDHGVEDHGVEDHGRFESAAVECGPGDLFLLLTDGLTEVFDRTGRELGVEGIRGTAFAEGTPALRELADRVFARAARHGPQLDDQTVLLLRIDA